MNIANKDTFESLKVKFNELNRRYLYKIQECNKLKGEVIKLNSIAPYNDKTPWENCEKLKLQVVATNKGIKRLHKANNKLTNDFNTLSTEVPNLVVGLNKTFREIDEKIQTIKHLRGKIENLKAEVSSWKSISKSLHQPQIPVNPYPKMLSKEAAVIKYDNLLYKIGEILTCPITLERFKNPVLTPSGNTIDEEMMDSLIQRNSLDPFTRLQRCRKITPNYLVKQLMEVHTTFSPKLP